MAASISDVAARAGVSVATVSRALRGLPNVAPSTRARVLDAARELDYVADPQASRLAAGRTKTIGMVVPMFTQWFFTQCVAGAEAVLVAAGYDVLLYNIAGTESRSRFVESMPFRKRVDGIIVIDLPLDEAEVGRLVDTDVPVVTIGHDAAAFPSVTIDNVAAGRAATEHLIALGHARIGLLSNLPDHPVTFTAPIERRRGYTEALTAHGLPVDPTLEAPGNFSLNGGAEAMATILATEPPPTAVFAESDEMAIGALKTLRDEGLKVPRDVSIIGFDDHEMAEYLGLTTIRQPVVALGEVGAGLLLEGLGDAVEAASNGLDARSVVMPTELVVRATTGPAPGLTAGSGPSGAARSQAAQASPQQT